MSILSSLVGLVIGIVFAIILNLIIKAVIYCTKRQVGLKMDMDIEHESHTPDTPLHPFANCTRLPAITTVKTTPGHALSDMDRDIKLQTTSCQDLQDLEAATPRIHRDSILITYGTEWSHLGTLWISIGLATSKGERYCWLSLIVLWTCSNERRTLRLLENIEWEYDTVDWLQMLMFVGEIIDGYNCRIIWLM